MENFKLQAIQHERGKCRKCGADLPDRFWNPYYCWQCFRVRNARIVIIITSAIAVLTVFFLTERSFLAAAIAALLVFLTAKLIFKGLQYNKHEHPVGKN